MTTGKYPHVVNVFFMLIGVRVEVKSGGIRDIAPGSV